MDTEKKYFPTLLTSFWLLFMRGILMETFSSPIRLTFGVHVCFWQRPKQCRYNSIVVLLHIQLCRRSEVTTEKVR